MTRIREDVNLGSCSGSLRRGTDWGRSPAPVVEQCGCSVMIFLPILSHEDVLMGLAANRRLRPRSSTDCSFQVAKPWRIFAVLGSMAVQGPVINWVADHRKHHAHSDEEGDPHSPHVGHGEGVGSVFRGLWHAHVGWLLEHPGPGRPAQVRARPRRGPRHAADQPPLPADRAAAACSSPRSPATSLTGTPARRR